MKDERNSLLNDALYCGNFTGGCTLKLCVNPIEGKRDNCLNIKMISPMVN